MKKTDLKISVEDRRVLAAQATDALKMHMIWMERGYAFLKGKPINLPAGFAGNDELCPVGHWLRERLDNQLRSLPLFERTNQLHDEFHRSLDQLFNQDIANVPRPLEKRFREVGDDLTRALNEWIALGRTTEPQR